MASSIMDTLEWKIEKWKTCRYVSMLPAKYKQTLKRLNLAVSCQIIAYGKSKIILTLNHIYHEKIITICCMYIVGDGIMQERSKIKFS